ncbi:MAG: Crp/Fnr family transcriptional regulator [Polyangiaceae bacterium]|nr:Crp/Fnr family transcriptional regulator [Polyangiaceae bacterium]
MGARIRDDLVTAERKRDACAACPLGKAFDEGRGGRCPLVDRTRSSGAWLHSEGETIDKISYIKSGLVVLSRDTGDRRGRGTAWAVRRAGSLLGIEGLVRSTYLDCARAVTDVTLCSASREDVKSWIDTREPVARTVLDLVLLTQSHDAPRRAGSEGNAMRRVALWLLDSAGPGIPSTLPRNVVAELLGMLPETFSRALAGLIARGAVEADRRSIRILSVEMLEEIGGAGEDAR